jgi:hypothetical protein
VEVRVFSVAPLFHLFWQSQLLATVTDPELCRRSEAWRAMTSKIAIDAPDKR